MADLKRIMSKPRKSADRQGILRSYDRSLLGVVPTPLRRMAGIWLLGLSLALPAIVAVFR